MQTSVNVSDYEKWANVSASGCDPRGRDYGRGAAAENDLLESVSAAGNENESDPHPHDHDYARGGRAMRRLYVWVGAFALVGY